MSNNYSFIYDASTFYSSNMLLSRMQTLIAIHNACNTAQMHLSTGFSKHIAAAGAEFSSHPLMNH